MQNGNEWKLQVASRRVERRFDREKEAKRRREISLLQTLDFSYFFPLFYTLE